MCYKSDIVCFGCSGEMNKEGKFVRVFMFVDDIVIVAESARQLHVIIIKLNSYWKMNRSRGFTQPYSIEVESRSI